MLWHLNIAPAPGQEDLEGRRLAAEAAELRLPGPWTIHAARGFLIEGDASADDLARVAVPNLVDPVVERAAVVSSSDDAPGPLPVVHVMPRPGVTDPEAESALRLLRDLGLSVTDVRTVRSYRLDGPDAGLPDLVRRVLSNDAVEHAVLGSLEETHLGQGKTYRFQRIDVPIRDLSDDDLVRVSKDGQLALSLAEMKTIQAHFAGLGRDATDAELETIAQTWSEHCSHKTLRGRIEFEG